MRSLPLHQRLDIVERPKDLSRRIYCSHCEIGSTGSIGTSNCISRQAVRLNIGYNSSPFAQLDFGFGCDQAAVDGYGSKAIDQDRLRCNAKIGLSLSEANAIELYGFQVAHCPRNQGSVNRASHPGLSPEDACHRHRQISRL